MYHNRSNTLYTDGKWALFVERAFPEFTTILPDYILDRTMDKNHKKPAKPKREFGGHKIGGTKSKDQGNFIEWVYTQKTARNGPRVVNPKWEIVDGKVKRKWTQLRLFLHLHEIVDGLYFHCWLSVCVSVCVFVSECLWTKFQPNGCTDLNAIFAKRLFNILARTLWKLVTLHQRSRSQWSNLYFFFIILC